MMNHRQNLRLYAEWCDLADLREGDRYLMVNPYFHTFGYKAGLIASFTRGATMVPVPVFDVDRVVELIEAERITMLPGPPTLYHSLLAVEDKAQAGDAACRGDRRRRHPGRADPAGARGAAVPDAGDRLRPDRGGHGDAVAAGRFVRGHRHHRRRAVRRRRGAHRRRRRGAGPRLQRHAGLPRRPRRHRRGDRSPTAGCTPATWARSTTPAGCAIVGRKKDMFIVGGFNAYPAEIEGFLLEHPAVAQAAVIGVPDERMGQVGKAFVVRKAGNAGTVDRRGADRLEPRSDGRFQGAAVRRVPRRATVERHRQSDEGPVDER